MTHAMSKHNPRLAFQVLALPIARQATPRDLPFSADLSQSAVFADWQIWAHPALSLTGQKAGANELLCVGTIIDPRAPASSDAALVERLLGMASFDEVETALAGLGGRWLLLIQIRGELRAYGDAGGLRTCFYAATPDGLVLGSQPSLVSAALGSKPEHDPRDGLARSAHADAYPLGVTPYRDVAQLLPNHFLDLRSGQIRRHWPCGQVPMCARDEAAHGIAELLRGSIHALVRRGKRLALPLTAGYDSRALLAAAWEVRSEIGFFTVVDLATSAHDVVLPLRLARAFGLEHSFVHAGDTTQAQMDLLVSNTGGVWCDPNEQRVPAFGKPEAEVVLLGNVSEVIRAGYYEYGYYPEQRDVDAALLARLSGWNDDAIAISACAEWLKGVPQHSNVHVLDLFFWEQAVGGWAALDSLATDTVVEVISPYNCRELLALGLGVPLSDRSVVDGVPEQSCLLHRRICEVAAPETLSFPFNDGWLGPVVPLLRSALPPPMRGLLLRLRRAARGLPRFS